VPAVIGREFFPFVPKLFTEGEETCKIHRDEGDEGDLKNQSAHSIKNPRRKHRGI
jgi:hypothetical protein